MTETSRRGFIAVTGAGVTAGAVALSANAADAVTGSGTAAKESVVAWVPDHHSDQVHLMVGEREVIVHDRALVRRILAAAGGQ